MSRVPAVLDRADPSSPLHYSASQTALLLLDYQNFTVPRCVAPAPASPDAESAGSAAVIQAAKMRDWALSKGILVVHCLIGLDQTPPDVLRASSRLKPMMAMRETEDGRIMIGEDARLAYQPSEAPEKEVTVFRLAGKISALESDGLNRYLAPSAERPEGIKSILMGGLSTSGCTLSTAKATADRLLVSTVLGDLCADATEEVHRVILDHCLPQNCHVVRSEEYQAAWERR